MQNTIRFIKPARKKEKLRGYFSYITELVYNLNKNIIYNNINNTKVYVDLTDIPGYYTNLQDNKNAFEYCFINNKEDYDLMTNLYKNIEEFGDDIMDIGDFSNPDTISKESREKTRLYIQHFIRPINEIEYTIDKYLNDYDFSKFIGVHRRSTDSKTKVTMQDYFNAIDMLSYDRIFLLCDNKRDYDTFIDRYGSKILCLDTTMSNDIDVPFFKSKSNNKDALYHCQELVQNIWLFSKCKKVVIPTSNYSSFALFLNPEIEYIHLK